jgi:signal peptidase I
MKKENPQPPADSETTEPSSHSSTREWYESLLVAAVFVLFVRTFVVQTYQVPTGSMETTILVGDHLLVNKFAYAPHLSGWEKILPYRAVHRGDIIVFKKPGDDINDGNVLVKRSVGTPGDVILVHAKKVTVNSETADGPHVQHIDPEMYAPGDPRGPRDYFGPYTVPAGDYFGMGDNRDNSLDSRFWGPVPRSNIFGRPFLIYWSYDAEPNSHIWRGPVAKIQQLLSVAVHFFSRTRWDRMFHLVR